MSDDADGSMPERNNPHRPLACRVPAISCSASPRSPSPPPPKQQPGPVSIQPSASTGLRGVCGPGQARSKRRLTSGVATELHAARERRAEGRGGGDQASENSGAHHFNGF